MTFSVYSFKCIQDVHTGVFSPLELVPNEPVTESQRTYPMGISGADLKLFQHDVTTIEPRDKYVIISINYTSYIVKRDCLTVVVLTAGMSEKDAVHMGKKFESEALKRAYEEEVKNMYDTELRKYSELLYIGTILRYEVTRLKNSLEKAQELITQLSKVVPDDLKKSVEDINSLGGQASSLINAFKYLFDDDLEVLALCFENQVSRRKKLERDNALTNQPFHFPKYGIQTDSETSDSSESISDEDYPVPLDAILTFLEKYYFEVQSIGSTAIILKQKITDAIFFRQLQLDTKRNFFLGLDAVLGIISCGCLIVTGVGNFFGANVLNPWNFSPPGPLSTQSDLFPDILSVSLWIACPAVIFIVTNLLVLFYIMQKNKKEIRMQDLISQFKS
ncbi:Metal ion transporter CorA-like divalent cation transporter family protein [Giardia duodenalis]|uniref:Metal ion transporter CorA-like divalent cation transporter family protein n=2 Tax=Giardia intestinalis TaxID=5741 RepID=A8BQ72_GIAIC|nr:Metal ion transporter CorA-like divalent cation transporter family protein [Giardia intestinalis]ESU38234.1 Hypothetical protein DHA2_2812 [Giardia intestinalis]KAE8304119.1 Metal ion transporter CorA-like divalent cation transporter family protein [Giardia intestinalis]|eukprot:XP_001705597.1 Hypothetical protein GL50803_2812 [Giardia lamblia ATCC 50803]